MADTATPLTMDTIVSLCRRRGFVFPSSEIYGGLGSTYDYGHYGVLTKNNIRGRWLQAMVQERDDIVLIDSAIILHPRVWEASGHERASPTHSSTAAPYTAHRPRQQSTPSHNHRTSIAASSAP